VEALREFLHKGASVYGEYAGRLWSHGVRSTWDLAHAGLDTFAAAGVANAFHAGGIKALAGAGLTYSCRACCAAAPAAGMLRMCALNWEPYTHRCGHSLQQACTINMATAAGFMIICLQSCQICLHMLLLLPLPLPHHSRRLHTPDFLSAPVLPFAAPYRHCPVLAAVRAQEGEPQVCILPS
jgi:hypothetical protein